MSNWSAGTIGTVWIGMICAGALPATISRTTKRRTTRLVIRHLARLESPDTEDTQHTVRRVTGRRGRRASVALARHGLSRSVALGGSLSRVHPQQRVDRTLPCPRGLEGADRDEDPRQQAPSAWKKPSSGPTSGGESPSSICIAYMHPEDRVTWRTRPQRGST